MPKETLMLTLGADWFLSDFELMIKAISDSYQIFYAINYIESYYNVKNELDKLRNKINLSKEELRILHKINGPHQDSFPYLLYTGLPTIDYGSFSTNLVKGNWNIDVEDRITIKKIIINSPGEIHLNAGDALREVRELIKDLSYRNDQDKKLGEMRIIEKQIEILVKLGCPKQEIGNIILSLEKNGTTLMDMICKGKIGLLIDKSV